MKFLGALSILMAISFSHSHFVQAEAWDLGYTNPEPEVEEIPDSISDQKAEIVEVPASGADQEKPPIHSAPSSNSITKISTQQNTYGVETVEKPGIKLYLSPFAGITSIMGNETVNTDPQYAYGGRVGLLVSDNLMIEGGYTYSVVNTSTPVNLTVGTVASDVFALKQNVGDVGAKFFFLGRESRFRPFIGGGFAYASSTLNYTDAYAANMGLTNDYKMKQWQGLGQLGAELAITRGIVATAAFKLNGILSSNADTAPTATAANNLEASKAQAGSSLSHSATYTGSIGVGVYF